jgi:hypothetical protein
MERWNSEGLPRDQLAWALRTPHIMADAKQRQSCLLCCSKNINEAALCSVCWALLTEEELSLAIHWLRGTQP